MWTLEARGVGEGWDGPCMGFISKLVTNGPNERVTNDCH